MDNIYWYIWIFGVCEGRGIYGSPYIYLFIIHETGKITRAMTYTKIKLYIILI